MPGGTDMLGKWKSVVLLTTLTDRARQAISGLQPIAACPHVIAKNSALMSSTSVQ